MALASKKQKQEVEKWFSNLRNEICTSFENIENSQTRAHFVICHQEDLNSLILVEMKEMVAGD